MSNWTIEKSKRVENQIKKLSSSVRAIVFALFSDLEKIGPKLHAWPNYSPLSKQKKVIPADSHHCHLKKGKPTYVACWCVIDKNKKLIEMTYVGTHENAPYQ